MSIISIQEANIQNTTPETDEIVISIGMLLHR